MIKYLIVSTEDKTIAEFDDLIDAIKYAEQYDNVAVWGIDPEYNNGFAYLVYGILE